MGAIKTVNSIIVCVWVILLSILLYKNYTGSSLQRAKVIRGAFHKETYWYDIYKKGKKIGSAVTSFHKAGDEVIISQERSIHVVRQHTKEKTLLYKKIRCLADEYYSIRSFEYHSHLEGKQGIRVTGSVDEDSLSLLLESPKKRKTVRLPLKNADFHIPLTLIPVIHQEIPAPDMRLTTPILNFSTLSVDNVNVVLEEIKPLKIGQNVQNVYKYRLGDLVIWSNERGVAIKEQLADTALYIQTRKQAEEEGDRILFDVTSLPYFKSNKRIDDQEALKRLTVRVKGFSLSPRLYDDTPVTLRGDTLMIEKEDLEKVKAETYAMPPEEEALQKHLNPDEWVSSDYQPIHNTGRSYARTYNNDAFRFAQYLNTYVYNLIKTWSSFVLSDAEDVLTTLSGDYLERTVLFASYARAGGLPTRLVSGLVYINGYFYFHAWPEVWIKGWVPVDPALFQFPADVTHIPLREGKLTEIISIIENLGTLKIEILEAL